jgi:hypothetical protein
MLTETDVARQQKVRENWYRDEHVSFPTDARIVFCGHWGVKLAVSFRDEAGRVHVNTLVDIGSEMARRVAPPYLIQDALKLERKLATCGFTWEEDADVVASRREAEQVAAGVPFDEIR